jgi:hypothetical protein
MQRVGAQQFNTPPFVPLSTFKSPMLSLFLLLLHSAVRARLPEWQDNCKAA